MPDHYFWFGPGETEYVIEGFYADAEHSWPFVFGEAGAGARRSSLSGSSRANSPAAKRTKTDAPPVVTDQDAHLAKQVGVVRIQFAKVVKWMKPQKTSAPRRDSLKGAAAHLADAKGAHIATTALKTTERDRQAGTADPLPRREAVLSPKILHECRLFYNDFAGYRKQSTIGKAMLEPLTFQGLPLSALKQADVRRRGLETFLRSLQRRGAESATERRIWSFGNSDGDALKDEDPNQNVPIPVLKLARFLSKTLSPAATRVVCQGATLELDDDDDNYGERHVQRFSGLTARVPASDTERRARARDPALESPTGPRT